MKNTIEARSFYRIGVVVKNAEEKLQMFEKHFGVKREEVKIYDTSDADFPKRNLTYNGEPCDYTTMIMIFKLGDIEIELLQPLNDKGPYAEWLEAHGEGLHHFNIDVADMPGFFEKMKELNMPFLTGGQLGSVHYEYYDTRELFGMILEGCEEKAF